MKRQRLWPWKSRTDRKPCGCVLQDERSRMLSDDLTFAVAEAYRTARTNLMYLPITAPCRRIAVTSAFASEGKTITTINLALVLAQSGQRVLLMDADMRRPRIEKMFEVHAESGLSEFLAGMVQEPATIPSDSQNLWLLTSGKTPPNPAELLALPRMDALLDTLEKQFDYILIDTPPVNVVTDASLLTKRVHGFLLSVLAEYSNINAIRDAAATLEQLGATVYGFILGNVDPKNGGYGGKHQRYGRDWKYGDYRKKISDAD